MKNELNPEVCRVPFDLELMGYVIPCVRLVSGTEQRRQHIHIPGVGSKFDQATYGPNFHPVELMEKMAIIIALELVCGSDVVGTK